MANLVAEYRGGVYTFDAQPRLFRLAQEPRRLARRYLVDDPHFARILWRTWREPRGERVRELPA